MKTLTIRMLIAATIALGATGMARADGLGRGRGLECDSRTLRGAYVFAATGYNIVGGAAQPKAIVELIEFHGDGTLTVTGGKVTVNGVVSPIAPNGIGNYSLDPDCNGTLVFIPGPSFDLFVDRDGKTGWMIQSNQNTVFEGALTRRN